MISRGILAIAAPPSAFGANVVVADINGDRKPDLAVCGETAPEIALFIGKGTATSSHQPRSRRVVHARSSRSPISAATGSSTSPPRPRTPVRRCCWARPGGRSRPRKVSPCLRSPCSRPPTTAPPRAPRPRSWHAPIPASSSSASVGSTGFTSPRARRPPVRGSRERVLPHRPGWRSEAPLGWPHGLGGDLPPPPARTRLASAGGMHRLARMTPEDLDLAELVQSLRAELKPGEPVGYLRGKVMRTCS